jgi:hypothetical protein
VLGSGPYIAVMGELWRVLGSGLEEVLRRELTCGLQVVLGRGVDGVPQRGLMSEL